MRFTLLVNHDNDLIGQRGPDIARVSIIDPNGVGASGFDFDHTTLNDWWHAVKTFDLTASGHNIEMAMCKGGQLLREELDLGLGYTGATDPRNWFEVRPLAGHGHPGLWDVNQAYLELGSPNFLVQHADDLTFKWTQMQFRTFWDGVSSTDNNGNTGRCVYDMNNNENDNKLVFIDRCIFIQDDRSRICFNHRGGGSNTQNPDGTGARNSIIKSSVIISNGHPTVVSRTGVYVENISPLGDSDGKLRVYNSTVVAPGGTVFRGHPSEAETELIVQNCFAHGFIGFQNVTQVTNSHTNNASSATVVTDPAAVPLLRGIGFNTSNFINPTADVNFNYQQVDSPSVLIRNNGLILDHNQAQSGIDEPNGFVFRDIRGTYLIAGSGVELDPLASGYPIGAYDAAFNLGGKETTVSDPNSIGGFIDVDGTFDQFAFLGGRIRAQGAPNNIQVGILGGYIEGFANLSPVARFGGYIDSLPLNDSSGWFIGGAISGAHPIQLASLGGFIWGVPNFEEYAETHARTLAIANSETTQGQSLNIDATILFKQVAVEDFFGKMTVEQTFESDFGGKLKVGQFKKPPIVVIIDVTPMSGISPQQVCVTASGNLRDGAQWADNYIDFGEPVRDGARTPNASISGFDQGTESPTIWSGCYTYRDPGVYVVTARGVDNFGMVGMDAFSLNLASGLFECIDYPCISISGIPRFGDVPPSLVVNFTIASSGDPTSSFPIGDPADGNLYWNFGNRKISQRKAPFTNYASPGVYIPVARFRHETTGGGTIWVSDSLIVGFNN